MTNVFRTALILFLACSIPLAAAIYKYTPRPLYVDTAAAVLAGHEANATPVTEIAQAIQHREHTAAQVIRTMPAAYSISAAIMFSWVGVLILGCVVAHIATVQANRTRTLTSYQRFLLNGAVVLLITNGAMVFACGAIYPHLMDMMIMWNTGMLIILAHLSLGLTNSGMFRCLTHLRTLRMRKQVVDRRKATLDRQ